MEHERKASLIDRLCECARSWNRTHDAAPSRLGRLVVNDGGLVPKLERGACDVTTATLVKFAEFFVDADNWPNGDIPEEAISLARDVGVRVDAKGLAA